VMNKVKYPYNINVLTAGTVLAAIKEVKGRIPGPDVREILLERIKLADKLRALTSVLKVFPSDANFLLVKFIDPKGTYRYLVDHGIVVRDRSSQALCEGCLRITVGTAAENERLINILTDQPKG